MNALLENFDPHHGSFSLWSKIGRLIYLTKYIFYYRPVALNRLVCFNNSGKKVFEKIEVSKVQLGYKYQVELRKTFLQSRMIV